jgi:hypothetical protein
VRFGYLATPSSVRNRLRSTRDAVDLPWLQPDALAEVNDALRRENAGEPARWGRWVHWYARRRFVLMADEHMARLGRSKDVSMGYFFRDERFLAALARHKAIVGIGDRTAMMRELFGDLLPARSIERGAKALAIDIQWSERTRNFIDRMDTSLLPDHVDGPALQDFLRRPHPSEAALIVQWLWLAGLRDGVHEDGNGVAHDVPPFGTS